MISKIFLQKLGFIPKDNASGIFYKNYRTAGNYCIEVDIEARRFNFGNKIKLESGTTQNFSQEENWVVFECVNRLIEKGYKPGDITLEKTWEIGHGSNSIRGRLDILVNKNKKAYLMIECKTWGHEFEKEFKKIQKDGGQLFTYFQQDKKAEYLILYTSQFDGKEIDCKNEIIKIEEHYREAGNVKDFYDRWNKLTKQNGIFDPWVSAYEFQSKALTKKDLKIIKQEDSSFIFNRFLEILRHNVVSDKPNAFNKIFTLFLCKIIDEYKLENEQLGFQWLESEDNNISFQKRLADLYKRGMKELLEKDVKDLSDNDFNNKYKNIDDSIRKRILDDFTEIRLKKNNEFAFKEVFDDLSFEDNAKVVKEVVELLQGYQLRYNQKHQYLGDFFELLLTTGLKQESGQFFTPVPVAKFIIKSLPIKEIIDDKIKKGNPNDLLPSIIDYAAGSGHFLTESMDDVQKMIDKIDEEKLNIQLARKIKSWKSDQFNWAIEYIYGIEKDYRLVKTAKVSCYLHGDGLAKVIHGDGLGAFNKTPEYKEKLREIDHEFPQDNKQFDIVISNPPYSVSAFKGTLTEENAKNSFDLFSHLTDQSSEIECLFIERTKQLLKDGGFAGIILPSSILSNTGIYTETREVLLKYFEIVAITELGSGTFMATGTNTVILFLRRRTNYEWENINSSVEKFFQNYKDVTVNGIENVFSKYIKQVWSKISFEDYVSLCQNNPNIKIKKHDIYKEYDKKIKSKNEEGKLKTILEVEKEKLLYFILAYPQKVVVVKSGKKKEEKAFLGYEFSNRRGHEGIYPVQRSKSIDECTKMFDPKKQENPEKASFYVYKLFLGESNLEINKSIEKHVSYVNLVDMITFDRFDFEKKINTNAARKVKIISKFEYVFLENLATFQSGLWKSEKKPLQKVKVLRNTNFKLNNGRLDYSDVEEIEVEVNQLKERKLKYGDIILEKSGGSDTQAIGRVVLFDKKDTGQYSYSNFCARIRVINEKILSSIYLWLMLNNFYDKGGTISLQNGVRLLNIDMEGYKKIKIPLPPKNIQEKIISEIEKLGLKEKKILIQVDILKKSIENLLQNNGQLISVENLLVSLKSTIIKIQRSECQSAGKYPVISQEKEFIIGYTDNENPITDIPVIVFGDHNCFFKYIDFPFFQGADGIKILRPNVNKILPKFFFYSLQNLEIENTDKYMRHYGYLKIKRITVPIITEQQKIVAQIQKVEDQIFKLNQELQEIKNRKEEVLKKYL